MSNKENHAASVLAKLLNYSRIHKQNYQALLIRYVTERFLYRLGQSEFRNNFILKGSHLLIIILENQTYRPTKDIDFLKTGESSSEVILRSLKEICSISCTKDGVEFNIESIRLQNIRDHNTYHGYRAKIEAFIGKARVVLQIDIGIGDYVYPDPIYRIIPSILDQPTSVITSYPIETVIAEKLHAIVVLDLLTSRMKDFYDLYIITSVFTLDYLRVKGALDRTFGRRSTPFPEKMPPVLSEIVYDDEIKNKQWNAFTSKLKNEYSSLPFSDVIIRLQDFSSVFFYSSFKKVVFWEPQKGWI